MRYWDTSAIFKLYVPEQDSGFFLDLVADAQPVLSSSIAATELLCALHHKGRAGDLKPAGIEAAFRKFQADCAVDRIVLLPYGSDVVDEANKLVSLAFEQRRPIMIRSLDAIHLASASISKATSLVTTDSRLRAAAALLKLKLLP